MQIETFSGKVITTEVVKTYTDFQDASTSKTVDILTLTSNTAIIGLEVNIDSFFGSLLENKYYLSITNNLIINKNISNPTSLHSNQVLHINPELIYADISPLIIQATVQSEGNGGWSFTGNVNYYGIYAQSGFGVQSAAVSFGGYDNVAVSYKTTTEEYNGILWATSGAMSAAKSHASGCGTMLAGLQIGGFIASGSIVGCEEYNGATWGAGGNLNTARHNSGAAGTQTAGVCFGGYGTVRLNLTEEYNGTSWSNAGNMNLVTEGSGGCGIQTAALSINGVDATTTEEYDGTTWTTSVSTNIPRFHCEGTGTTTSALTFNGSYLFTEFMLPTELFDGTSWIIGNNSNIGRDRFGGCGTQTKAVQFGGQSGSGVYPTLTENWDKVDALNLSNLTSGNLTFKIKYINYNE